MYTLRLAAWIIAIIYSTVPIFWVVMHGRARRLRETKSPLAVAGSTWVGMWVAMAAITWPWHRNYLYDTRWSWLLAAPFLTAGIVLYALAKRRFGADQLLGRTEFHPHKHEQRLVTSGIRAYMRHPIYTGHFCELLGWAIGTGVVVVYGMALFAVITGIWMVRAEDRELEERFGEDYRRYRERVPAIIPRKRA